MQNYKGRSVARCLEPVFMNPVNNLTASTIILAFGESIFKRLFRLYSATYWLAESSVVVAPVGAPPPYLNRGTKRSIM